MTKRLLFFLCLHHLFLPATELERLQQTFLESLKSAEEVGMTWNEELPFKSNDWFRQSEEGIAKVPFVGKKGFRFMVIEVQAGEHTLLGLVDTGAASSLLSQKAAVKIGAHPIGPEIQAQPVMSFAGGRVAVSTHIPELRVGKLHVKHLRAIVFPQVANLPMLPKIGDRQIDILIGYDFLKSFDWLDVHQQAGFIRFGQGIPFDKKAPITRPLLEGSHHGPQVNVSVNQSDSFSVTLDTGGTFGLRLPGSMAEKLGVTPRDETAQIRKSGTGESKTVRGEKVNLSIGTLDMQNLPTHVNVGNDRAAEMIGPLIGNPALSRMHWVLDHKQQQVHFFLK